MFISGYANTKNVFYCLNANRGNSFKILIKYSTFNIDHEYDLRHVCAHTVIGKNVKYTVPSPNKEREKRTILFGHFIFVD